MGMPPLDFLQTPGGMPGAAPQLPMPNIPQPPPVQPQPERPSLWQRIAGGLGRIMAPPEYVPSAEMSMFASPEQIAAAQRNARNAYVDAKLSGGGVNAANASQIGQSTFDTILGNAVKVSQFARETRQAEEERAKQQKMETNRELLVTRAMNGANPQDPRDVAVRLNAVLPELLRIGDTKGYAALSGYLAANNALLNPRGPEMDVRVVDNVLGEDGKPYIVGYDNNTNAEVWRKPQFVQPRSDSGDRSERRLDAQNINAILDDYRNDAGKTVQLLTRIRPTIAEGNFQKALKGDAAAQISLLYGFVNLMDETAVREGEQAMVRMAGPLYEQAKGIIQRSVLGQSYSIGPTLLKQIHPIMKERTQSFTDHVKESRERAVERARILGVGGVDRLIRPFETEPAATGPLGPGQQMVAPRTGKVWQYDK